MLASEELTLLIKSKYPLIFVESIDEEYVVNELRWIATQLRFTFYQWSVTTGLTPHFSGFRAPCIWAFLSSPQRMTFSATQ